MLKDYLGQIGVIAASRAGALICVSVRRHNTPHNHFRVNQLARAE
jgi:hypothetical protein